jgi:hypothetical protein
MMKSRIVAVLLGALDGLREAWQGALFSPNVGKSWEDISKLPGQTD